MTRERKISDKRTITANLLDIRRKYHCLQAPALGEFAHFPQADKKSAFVHRLGRLRLAA
jgi:hypothetical protein